ncbi:MAG: hypothetical protein NW200_03160 [Hyphomonadaceae bacterium]|nr:hypothetical protein [Hyphomonadaceae bacterium]
MAALAALWAGAADAHAQIDGPIQQVPQSPSRASLAAAPEQIGRPSSRDGAAVSQLPAGLSERVGSARGEALTVGVAPERDAPETLAPSVRNAGSVDPDEIARLLATGEAASIDAAAAIASGATEAPLGDPAVREAEEMAARLRARMLPAGSVSDVSGRN